MAETDPRDVEWWNPTSPDFERAYADEGEDAEQLYPEWMERDPRTGIAPGRNDQ